MMNKIKILVMIPFLSAGMAGDLFAADGLEISHLGTTNTLVRVTGNGNILMLPVQESIDDAKVNVLVDGKIVDTFRVKLAKSIVDYSVPFDLTPYKGHNVILDVVTPQGRNSVREAKADACWSTMELTDSFVWEDTENRYRPVFHHAPEYGWMNDPNGMFYKDGVWHLYYQYNPYGSKWENMSWRHSTSTDLINWKDEGIALRPDGLGMIFSGSAVVDRDNTFGAGKDAIIAMYTSASTNQMQSVASSTDGGKTFKVYEGNPVVTLETEARDPKVFWNPEIGKWNMVLAHALDHEMLVYSSDNLKDWTLESSFGKGLGAQGGVWECPDLFELPVDGEGKSKWVLICNINPDGPSGGSGTQYFIGDFDGKTFTPDTDKDGNVITKWMDYGKDFYATVTWSDAPENRRTALGWMSNWEYAADVPTMQFRSANTLPRDLSLFRGNDGQIYLTSAPSPELTGMRGNLTTKYAKFSAGSKAREFPLPTANDGICEVLVDFEAGNNAKLNLTFANPAGEKVVMTYNAAERTLSFDRTQSGLVDFNQNFPAVTVTPTFETNGKISLRIFIDRSSMEVFGNGGKFVMTNLVFPNEPYKTLSVTGSGSAKVTSLKIYSLKN